MIMGAWGGYESGWTSVGPRLDWAAARFAEERNATSERLAAGESGDLAYEIFLEKADTRLVGVEDFHPMTLRVTHLYRREQGEWKLIQRHAHFLTPTSRVMTLVRAYEEPRDELERYLGGEASWGASCAL